MTDFRSTESELKMLQLMAYDTSLEVFRNATQEMDPDDFSDSDYKSIFVAFQECENAGEVPDLISMMRRLPAAKNDSGFREKLLDVFDSNTFFADCAMQYRTILKNIRDIRINALLLQNLHSIVKDIQEQKCGVVERLEQIVEQAQTLQSTGDDYEMSDELAYNAMFSVGRNDEKIRTGLLDVDKMLNGGYSRGSLNVIGARPSMGKSTLAMNIATNVLLANEKQNHVVYFTLEDPAISTVRRCELYIASVSEKEVLTDDDIATISRKINKISEEVNSIRRAVKNEIPNPRPRSLPR